MSIVRTDPFHLPKELRRGWILGGEEFRERVLALVDRLSESGSRRSGPVEIGGDHGEWMAERLLRAGLRHWKLEGGDLRKLRKSDWRKRVIGHLIKERTGVSLSWIGERLVMGTDSHVSRLCSRIGDLPKRKRIAAELEQIASAARQE